MRPGGARHGARVKLEERAQHSLFHCREETGADMNLEEAAKDLQDAMTIMAHFEKRQSTMLREHSERIVALEEQSAKFQQRTDQNLAEITDKLNGLIGYIEGQQPPRRQP
jgi:hypothetical protein